LPSDLAILDLAAVVALHAQLIEESGGFHGFRDAGSLESAIARAENKVNYDPEATVAGAGASLSWGLIKNHAFTDGNKRIGLGALAIFLRLNGLCSHVRFRVRLMLCCAWRRADGQGRVDGMGGRERAPIG